MDPLRVAVVQTNAGSDPDRNLQRIEAQLADAGDVDLIALPEVFALRGTDADYRQSAEPLDGPMASRLARLAAGKGVWLLAGSLIEKAGDAIYNTSVLFKPNGEQAATYRKIHLFEVHLDDGRVVRERDAYDPGQTEVVTEIAGWRAGLAICFDLRFPEQFCAYGRAGAQLFLVPSNFTQHTGRDHWEVLLKARAIENQCFVVAPNQCGVNPRTGIASHGHSMVIGPWGAVLAEAGDDEALLVVELDPHELERVRRRIPLGD